MSLFDLFKKDKMVVSDNKAYSTNIRTDRGDLNDETKNANYKKYTPNYLFKPPYGYPRQDYNGERTRELARTAYVFPIIKTILDEVSSISWKIEPKEGVEQTQELEKKINEITNFFKFPNENFETWTDITRAVVKDILELDAGVVNKVYNKKQKLSQITYIDGNTIALNPDLHGYYGNRKDVIEFFVSNYEYSKQNNNLTSLYKTQYNLDAAYFQYGGGYGRYPIPYGKKEIIYFKMITRSDSLYGFSPVQSLDEALQILIYGGRHNLDYYINNNMPNGIISIINANKEKIKAFMGRLKENIINKQDTLGNYTRKAHMTPVINSKAEFTPFTYNSRDMQVLEQQKWYQELVWSAFGVTTTEMGKTEDSNRATDLSQDKILKRKTIRPLLKKLEDKWNSEIMTELDDTGKLCFKYNDYDIEEDYRKSELNEKRLNFMTINEIREDYGLPKLEGDEYNKIQGISSQSQNTMFNFEDKTNNNNLDVSNEAKENKDKVNPNIKSHSQKADEDFYKGYKSFFKKLEDKVITLTKDNVGV